MFVLHCDFDAVATLSKVYPEDGRWIHSVTWTPQRPAAASSPCGSPSLRSTTRACTTCSSRLCVPSPRSARLCECATTAPGTHTLKVFSCGQGSGVALLKRCSAFADLRWVNIQNRGEAFKLLQYGNKNRSAAATKMNQSSSRRQVVFLVIFVK